MVGPSELMLECKQDEDMGDTSLWEALLQGMY